MRKFIRPERQFRILSSFRTKVTKVVLCETCVSVTPINKILTQSHRTSLSERLWEFKMSFDPQGKPGKGTDVHLLLYVFRRMIFRFRLRQPLSCILVNLSTNSFIFWVSSCFEDTLLFSVMTMVMPSIPIIYSWSRRNWIESQTLKVHAY